MIRGLTACSLAIVAGAVAGCGPRPGTDPTANVTGTVTLDGQPIERVSVAFMPESGRPASGLTDASGNFELSTFDTGDGAVLGKHKVVLSEQISDITPAPDDPNFATWKRPKPRFPKLYSDPQRTPFTVEVTEEEDENVFQFDMSTKPQSRSR